MDENLYLKAAQEAWQDIKAKVTSLHRDQGMKQEEIRRMLGIKSRSVVSSWLSGDQTSANASFPDMLRYLHILGLDIGKYVKPFIREGENVEDIKAALTRALDENRDLKHQVELLKKDNMLLEARLDELRMAFSEKRNSQRSSNGSREISSISKSA